MTSIARNGIRSPSGVSPTFDVLGCHTHATAPCSGRVRAWLWPATMPYDRRKEAEEICPIILDDCLY
jgi:hypothetical protein